MRRREVRKANGKTERGIGLTLFALLLCGCGGGDEPPSGSRIERPAQDSGTAGAGGALFEVPGSGGGGGAGGDGGAVGATGGTGGAPPAMATECVLPEPPDCPERVHEGTVLVSTQEELETLRGVTSLNGDLRIRSGSLQDLDALECLRTIQDRLEIDRNRQLVSLDGLRNLVSIGGSLDITDNTEADLGCGLIQLEEIGQGWGGASVDIGSNGISALRLPKLQRSPHLRIQRNSRLVLIEGPNAVTSLGQFWILTHPVLSSVTGFEGLTTVSSLRIADNPALPNCDALLILDRLVRAGFSALADISGNKETCP